MPFTDYDDSVPAHLQLEPLDSHEFRVVRGFKYRSPEPGEPTYVVGDPGRGRPGESTDLASVPFFLQWFIRSYGRHTLAAVLHDHLWRLQRDVRPLDNVAFKRSNHVFRVAMDELEVPLLRRWLMWAAVSLAWLWKREAAWKIRVVAWVAAVVGLDILTACVLVNGVGTPATVLAAVFLVAWLALLWPHPLVAAIGGPALYVLLPSVLIVLATLLTYLIVEAAVWGIGLVFAGATKRRVAPPHPPLLMRERHPQTVPRS
jgi:hypothetical protein